MTLLTKRPRIAEIAARAGVSPATVDRVLNGRPGVRGATVERVAAAIRAIADAPPHTPAMSRPDGQIDILLAGDASQVTEELGNALLACATRAGWRAGLSFVERMNPAALAERLHRCADEGSLGVAVQALDHVLVREALERLAECAIPLVTVLTDIAGVNRQAYVGLDNRAAGRTAGFLMGRFCRRPGHMAIVWGGQLYRSHEERESGFRNILRVERPDLQCLDVVTGGDDPAMARQLVAALLAREPDLAGIYCVGGSITGVVEAVEAAERAQSLVLIGHNHNAQTRHALLTGTIDALIHQDTARIAEQAFAALSGRRIAPDGAIPIEIITRENNVPR